MKKILINDINLENINSRSQNYNSLKNVRKYNKQMELIG